MIFIFSKYTPRRSTNAFRSTESRTKSQRVPLVVEQGKRYPANPRRLKYRKGTFAENSPGVRRVRKFRRDRRVTDAARRCVMEVELAGGLTRSELWARARVNVVTGLLTSSCLRSSFYLVERAAGGVLSRTGLAWAPGVERAGRASPPLRRPPSTVVALGAPLFLFVLARDPLPLTWGLRVPRRNTPRLYLSLLLSLPPRPLAISVSERETEREVGRRLTRGNRKRKRDE